MPCEDTGLTVSLKPGELKMDLLRSDRRLLRSQYVFLNLAGRSLGKFFDEGDASRRLVGFSDRSGLSIFILVLLSFVFVCRDLVASRRRQHILYSRRRLKLIVRRDEQSPEAGSICESRHCGESHRSAPAGCPWSDAAVHKTDPRVFLHQANSSRSRILRGFV